MSKSRKTVVAVVVLLLAAFCGGYYLYSNALLFAAANGRVGCVRLLLSLGVDVNSTDSSGETALHFAAKRGDRDLVNLLLSSGADRNPKGHYLRTPLHYAASEGHADSVRGLLDHGAYKEVRDTTGETPLTLAAHEYQGHVVLLLLARGAQLDSNYEPDRRYLGPTKDPQRTLTSESKAAQDLAFLRSVRAGNKEGVEQLLENGVNPNARSQRGHSALFEAWDTRRLEMMRCLLVAGATCTVRDSVGLGDVHALKRYLETNPQALSATDEQGLTLLHRAAEWGKANVIEFLVSAGAEVDSRTHWGATPLHLSAGRSPGSVPGYAKAQAAEALLNRGADVAARTNSGDTALHEAVRGLEIEVMKVLLEYRADPNAENDQGETPISLAPDSLVSDAVHMLERYERY